MKQKLWAVAILWLTATVNAQAQELFVYSEPASNMPAHSIGIRAGNWLMQEPEKINYHLIPEVMWGVNKRLMIHAEGFFSNRNKRFAAEGAGLYGKYRFYSRDGVYRHFRAAAFGRASSNNADIHQEEIETNGHNSGYELGLIGTQLLHKTALSFSASYERALDNARGNEFPKAQAGKAIDYVASAGHLFFPKKYTGYGQTNFNAMIELIGQYQPESGKSFVDIAPSLQFIFNSQTRVDVGYKYELAGNMLRTAPNGLLIRVEHLLFNVL